MRSDKATNGSARARRRNNVPRPGREGSGRLTLRGLLGLLAFAGVAYAVMSLGEPPLGVRLGEPAPRTYTARARFSRVNLDASRAAEQHARLTEPTVWQRRPEQWQAGVRDLMRAVEEGPDSIVWGRLPEDIEREAFLELLPALQQRADRIEEALGRLGELPLARPAGLEHSLVEEKQTTEIRLAGPEGESRTASLAQMVPLEGGAPEFREALAGPLEGLDPAEAALARRAMAAVLEPAVTLDVERSMESADRAAAAAPKVVEFVNEGRVLLSAGTEVRRQHILDLRSERERYRQSAEGRMVRLQRAGGLAVLLLLVTAGAAAYARRYRPELLARRTQLLPFVAVTLALVGVARLCIVHGVTPLWVPVPLAVMVMCLVFDQRVGAAAGIFLTLLVRLACPGANAEFFVLFVGAAVAALLSGQVRTRSTLIKAGVVTGAAQFCAVWGFGLMMTLEELTVPLQFWQSPLLAGSLVGVANGVLSGFVVSGVLPAIERLFGVTTDIRLLEWSDPNQPLLQRLLLDAPGSYHHSMVVGSLAADAAEAIGANALLARVSAYFHDVGKLKKPQYFAENLPSEAENPHDDLSPTMSSLIITAHPKDGAEMAERYGVPSAVRDVILQSHGCSVVRYFWDKAQQKNGERDELEEHDFRYRLPKPAGKEAAIVMLCDAAESAARSIGSPSIGQLQNLVRSIIMDRLNDGQLDESALTITDLKKLEDALVRGLAAVYHKRVSYPGQEETTTVRPGEGRRADSEERKSDAGGDLQPAERP